MPDRTEPRDAQSVREPHPFEAVPVAPGVSTLVAVRDPDPNAPALAALKRYANGKYFLYATTPRRCEARVLRALEASAELRISFDRAGTTRVRWPVAGRNPHRPRLARGHRRNVFGRSVASLKRS